MAPNKNKHTNRLLITNELWLYWSLRLESTEKTTILFILSGPWSPCDTSDTSASPPHLHFTWALAGAPPPHNTSSVNPTSEQTAKVELPCPYLVLTESPRSPRSTAASSHSWHVSGYTNMRGEVQSCHEEQLFIGWVMQCGKKKHLEEHLVPFRKANAVCVNRWDIRTMRSWFRHTKNKNMVCVGKYLHLFSSYVWDFAMGAHLKKKLGTLNTSTILKPCGSSDFLELKIWNYLWLCLMWLV